MKNYLKLTVLVTLFTAYSAKIFGQEQVAQFKDGTSVAFSVIDSTIDHMKKMRIAGEAYYSGIAGITGGFYANYFNPVNKFMVAANYQFNKTFGVEGAYFFTAKKKMAPVKLPLKYLQTGYNTATEYVITTNVQKATYFGLDAGYSQFPLNFQTMKWHEFYDNTREGTYYTTNPNTGNTIVTSYNIAAPPSFGEIAIGPALAYASKYRILQHELTGARKGTYNKYGQIKTNSSEDESDEPGEPAKDPSVHIKGLDAFVILNASILIYTSSAVDSSGFGASGESSTPPGKLPLSKTGFRISYGGGASRSLGKSGGAELGYLSSIGIEKNNAGWNLRIMAGLFLAF